MVKKKILFWVVPLACVTVTALWAAYKYIDPAPPHVIVLSSGEEGNFSWFAKQYQGLIKADGVTVQIRPSSGSLENLKRLSDPSSGVDAGFVQDGVGSQKDYPDVTSLGSLYYEPLWIFYKGKKTLTRLSDLLGKKIALGPAGSGTRLLATQVLKESGVTDQNSIFHPAAWDSAASLLNDGRVDAAFIMASPGDAMLYRMLLHKNYRLMSMDQAEAISQKLPFLHHLILPHGAIDLKENIPDQEIDLIAPTATLLVRNKLHPALIYLMMKSITQTHDVARLFQKKGEFPANAQYVFPLNEEARSYYKSGVPFWHRYLPFWLASMVNRFLIVGLPLIFLIVPIAKSVPKFFEWRLNNKFYQRYGELKFLEVLANESDTPLEKLMHKLKAIEDRVNHMKVPVQYSVQMFGLRQNIQFARQKIIEEANRLSS